MIDALRRRRPKRFALWAAAAAALALHAVLLGVMGSVTPRVFWREPPQGPAMQISLLPPMPELVPLALKFADGATPRPVQPLPGLVSPLEGQAKPQVARPIVQPPSPPATTAHADFPGFFHGGVPGCGREDFILLHPDERIACQARIAAAAAAERTAHFADAAPLPPLATLPADRRAAMQRDIDRRRRREDSRADPVPLCSGEVGRLGGGCLPGSE